MADPLIIFINLTKFNIEIQDFLLLCYFNFWKFRLIYLALLMNEFIFAWKNRFFLYADKDKPFLYEDHKK